MDEKVNKALENRVSEKLARNIKIIKDIERIKDDGSCGGYKHCKNRECDERNEDCKQCIEYAYEAIKESCEWIN